MRKTDLVNLCKEENRNASTFKGELSLSRRTGRAGRPARPGR
jgi:hypothetical protein